MTLPIERTRALIQTKEFLETMLDPKQTPPGSRDGCVAELRLCCGTIPRSRISRVHTKRIPDLRASAFKKGVTMQWICKALLRYRRNGTGPVAEALSEDPYKREIELALLARATALMLRVLRPEVPR